MDERASNHQPTYDRVYQVVRQVPLGKVATYGQIAAIVGRCTARMVGYAMGSLPPESDVPWHRIINAQGKISPRGARLGVLEQQERLEEEGVEFDPGHKIDLSRYRWSGPDLAWLLENGFDPEGGWTAERQ